MLMRKDRKVFAAAATFCMWASSLSAVFRSCSPTHISAEENVSGR